MKKSHNLQLITGVVLLMVGLGCPALKLILSTELTYAIILMTESVWLTCALFGAALIISGIINKALGDKKTEYSTRKTEIYAHLTSAALSIGLFCFSMWQIIVSTGLEAVNSTEYTVSVILTVICIVSVFLLCGFSAKERKETGKKKGVLFDIITVLLYLLPFFFLSDTVYKMMEGLR